MGDSIKCPSCCDKVFASKTDLIEHLARFLGDIACPICNNKWSSVAHLVEHLTLDNCHQDSVYEPYSIAIQSQQCDSQSDELMKPKLDLLDNDSDPLSFSKDNKETEEDGKMYVEFLSKQSTRACLQTQEVKLVKDNGVSRYVFFTDDDVSDLDDNSTIVTKQNNDGTISLTAVKEVSLDGNTLISPETEADNHEEIYSCNTCGVSFTSVIDHIQNYHNDQDVVVEGQVDEMESACGSNPSNVKTGTLNTAASKEKTQTNDQPGRRVITDTGDIVETPVLKTTSISLEDKTITTTTLSEAVLYSSQNPEKGPVKNEKDVTVKKERVDDQKTGDIKNIKEPDSKSGPYHKVVIKEMTTGTGQNIRMFQCIACNVHVNNLDDFKTKPCKMLKYKCSLCPVSYINAKSLCAHMKVHKEKPGAEIIPKDLLSYSCEICLTVFTTNKSLKLHKRMHDPIKERPIEPPIETPEGAEGSGDMYLCQVCLKLIPIDYRTIHQNSHKDIERFNCDICNKKFDSGEYLDMHMSVHNVDKVTVGKQDESLPYVCVYCDRRFARPHEKVKHERIHTGEKPHSCEICGKSFRVSYCLTLHMRTHTGARPYACKFCGKRFKAHSVYNHHLLTHSDVRAYKCPYCPKAFKTSVQLAGHKNSHTKPFSCQYCNRPFASLYAVRVHTETHTRQNNLKFSCNVCGASYARAFALKDHVKQAHSDGDAGSSGAQVKHGEIIMEIINPNELAVP